MTNNPFNKVVDAYQRGYEDGKRALQLEMELAERNAEKRGYERGRDRVEFIIRRALDDEMYS